MNGGLRASTGFARAVVDFQPPRAQRLGSTLGTMLTHLRGSIVVSISACHAEDPGSIPGRGVLTPSAGDADYQALGKGRLPALLICNHLLPFLSPHLPVSRAN